MRRDGGGSRELARALRSSYWREGEARTVLDAWTASGSSIGSFAEKHGIAASRLLRWKKRLDAEPAMTFHPVEIVETIARRDDGTSSCAFELVLRDGRRIVIGSEFDARALRRLVETVESWPC